MAKKTPNINDMIRKAWALYEARPEYLNQVQEGHQEYNCGWNDAISEYWQGIRDLPEISVDLSAYSDKLWSEAYERGKADGMPTWTPCSEQLPEREGRYLCTNNELGGWVTSINMWLGDHWLYPNEKPIAWMPLPDAWEGEQDE